MAALIALALTSPVPLHRFWVGGAVLLPVAAVIAAPLAGAFATDLPVLGI